jgi:hypothetical protein
MLESAAAAVPEGKDDDFDPARMAAKAIFRLAKEVHDQESTFLRAVCDAIDVHKMHKNRPADPLGYWLCIFYTFMKGSLLGGVIDSDGVWHSGHGDPNPLWKETLEKLHDVPALKIFFTNRENGDRQARRAADKLGLKYRDRPGQAIP